MRALTFDEMTLVAGGQEEQGEVVDLGEIVVTAQRRARRAAGFIADLFGFDSGSFNLGDVGVSGGVGYVTFQVGGVGYAQPVDEDGTPMVGFEVGVDLNPADGSITPSLPNGVSYDPGLNPGVNVGPGNISYWHTVPSTTGGISMYPVPGGQHGEYYWGYPPGSPLSPFPNY